MRHTLPLAVVLTPVDPNSRSRLRRQELRRRHRRRRLIALAVVLGFVAAFVGGVAIATRHTSSGVLVAPVAARKAPAKLVLARPRALPPEVRGVHVTMALASIPGKLEQYMKVPGLNTIELDVKDESGRVAFVQGAPALARQTGAAGRFYLPKEAVSLAHKHGVYLIGRVVCFEDPVVSAARPSLAIRTADGGIWRNRAGLGWGNEYSRAYWQYLADVASAAARAGFDEIQLDYVRFPTDGDVSNAVWPGKRTEKIAVTMADFVRFMTSRLHPQHVRVSADVFGLSANRDLGIGQLPGVIGKYLDAVYPMVYPSHYGPGEYGLPQPDDAPELTVARSLLDFQRKLDGKRARVIPWLQDFSLQRTYTLADVRAQIAAARNAHSRGFLLWNASGVYTDAALQGG